jgi:hypothetical protein
MDTSRTALLANFAQAQLEAAVDSFRQGPTRTSLHDLRTAVATFERYRSVVRQHGRCHVLSPFRSAQR